MIFRRAEKGGFSLIELLVVIGIIALLSTIVTAAVNEVRKKARLVAAQKTLRELRTAIAMLKNDTGQWPMHNPIDYVLSGGGSNNERWNLDDADVGLVQTDGNFPNWNGPYIKDVPEDPWGNDYFYDTDYDIDPGAGTRNVTVIGSFGPNGVGQNIYDSDNVIEILAQ